MNLVYNIVFFLIWLMFWSIIIYLWTNFRYNNKKEVDNCFKERKEFKEKNESLEIKIKEDEENIKKLRKDLEHSNKEIAEKNKYLSEDKVIIERLIENSSNPLWRKQKHHNWSDSDFFIIKQGNTSERLAGFMRGDIFHIALAYPNHDEYETELPKYKVSDFDDEEFMEWKAEIINENSSTDLDSLQVEYDLLTLKNKTLEEENLEVQILKEDIKDKDTKIKESVSALKNLRKEQAKLKNKVQEFENLSFFEKFKLLFA